MMMEPTWDDLAVLWTAEEPYPEGYEISFEELEDING